MLLRSYLDQRGTSIAAFARALGVHASVVYRWLAFEAGDGGNPPTIWNAITMQRRTRGAVPVEHWSRRKATEAA